MGRGDAQEVRETIRGDQIQWIDPGQAEACDRYLAAMDQLRLAINQGLFLGLRISSAILPCTHPVHFIAGIWTAFVTMIGAWSRRCFT